MYMLHSNIGLTNVHINFGFTMTTEAYLINTLESRLVGYSISILSGITHTTSTCRSRLGCQIMVTKALDGLKVTVPSATRDIRNT